jgi:hypothetical protein
VGNRFLAAIKRRKSKEAEVRTKVFYVVALLGILGANTSNASVVQYTNLAAFNAAVGSTSTLDFSSVAPATGYTSIGNPGSVTINGISIDASAFLFAFGASTGLSPPPSYGPFLSAQAYVNTENSLTISLSGTSAIGFHFGAYCCTSVDLTATLNTGDAFNAGTPNNAGSFLGFISDSAPITSVTLQGIAPVIDLIDVVTPTVQTIPLPATLPLFASGLGALGLLGRRWKKKNATSPL